MRFGSVDTFFEPTEWRFRMGRPIANEGFLRALLTYGGWDAYHFFCPDTAHVRGFGERVVELLRDEKLVARVFASPQAHLTSALEQHDFTVFHQGDFTYFLPWLAPLRTARARRPFPITGVTHSLDGAAMQLRFLQLALAGLLPFDAVVCTSAAAARLVEAKLAEVAALVEETTGARLSTPARTALIPLGIDDELFVDPDPGARAAARAEARRYLHVPDDVTVALSVGRLSLRTKADWAPVLEELARMAARGELSRFLLLVAGGGQDEAAKLVQSLIDRLGLGAHVLLFPNFPAEAKPRLYQAADLYVSLVDNYQETLGLSVLEAAASALPILAADFDGYRDSVGDGDNGFLVPTLASTELPDFLAPTLGLLDPGVARFYLAQSVALDLDRFGERLRALVGDAALRRRMGERSRARAEGYRWRAVIARYEELWVLLSAEAAVAPPPSTDARAAAVRRTALLAGDGIRAFSHFPSRMLDPGMRVTATATARDKARFTRYEDLAAVQSSELEAALLRHLARPRTVGELRQEGARAFGATAGDVDFHLLWLAKHGAVRVE